MPSGMNDMPFSRRQNSTFHYDEQCALIGDIGRCACHQYFMVDPRRERRAMASPSSRPGNEPPGRRLSPRRVVMRRSTTPHTRSAAPEFLIAIDSAGARHRTIVRRAYSAQFNDNRRAVDRATPSLTYSPLAISVGVAKFLVSHDYGSRISRYDVFASLSARKYCRWSAVDIQIAVIASIYAD